MNDHDVRQIKVIATMALGDSSRPRIELNIRAQNRRPHHGECLLIELQEVNLWVEPQEAPITAFKGRRTLDLFSPQLLPQFLGASPAPVGRLSRVEVSLSRVSLWLSRGRTLQVPCLAGAGDVLTLHPHQPLQTFERGVLSLALLFDTEPSIKEQGSLLRLEPVVYLRRLVRVEPYSS